MSIGKKKKKRYTLNIGKYYGFQDVLKSCKNQFE